MSSTEQRLAKLETKIDDHSKLLEKQSDKNDTLTRLVTLFETQESANKERELRQEQRDKKQQEQLDKFGNAMEEVVVSLSNINQSQQQLGERVTEIEGTLSQQKIDPIKLFKSILRYVATAGAGIVVAWIYIKLGLK